MLDGRTCYAEKYDRIRQTRGRNRRKKILVEIKSVNHRYSDYNIKVQRHLGFLEDKIRKYVSSSITRGKVDIYLNVENYETADKQITLNKEIAKIT